MLVLRQHKLNEIELDIIFCQCCIISIDYQNLNYKTYSDILKGNSAPKKLISILESRESNNSADDIIYGSNI